MASSARFLPGRQTRDVMLVKVAGQGAETVVNAQIKHGAVATNLYESLTWVRDTETAQRKRFTLASDIKGYSAIR